MSTFKIEAEATTLTGYRLESKSIASGGQLISLAGGDPAEVGTASFAFSGPSGIYDVVVGYFDESDGISRLQIRKQGISIDAWDLNQNRGSSGAGARTLVPRTVATGLTVNQGETIAISAIENAGEPARVDYIEFIPLTSTTINGTNAGEILGGNRQNDGINGFGGNDTLKGGAGKNLLDGGSGIDTVSYEQANKGVIVSLGTNIAFTSAYSKPLKIMPLGDSITYGVVDSSKNDRESGGYRTPLWNKLVANGLGVDFVGSVSSGPSSLGDQDHEGHPGWTSQQIAININGWLDTYEPDVVLLMIGTNDARRASASTIGTRLSDLIDQITTRIPNSQLLVAAIPPIDGAFESDARAQRAAEFNLSIPSIVSSKVAQGKKVTFVDTRSKLTLNDLADGLHPNAGGYNKISDYWYNAILNTSGEKDTLSNIENITGSAFNDVLTGNAGINVIQGDAGTDTLTGDDGADTFVYKETGGKDIITDFRANDLFSISASGFGGGLVAGMNLSTTDSATGVFVGSTTPTPLGSSANFLYNTNTGLLNFDRDGTGADAAFTVATLTGAPSLGVAQFVISS